VWQLARHRMLHDRYMNLHQGMVVAVEHDWIKTFALLPHKTIGNKYVWLKKIYVRRVWVYTGFIDEPETQYAELFDILQDQVQSLL
jgi:hypothetical protein